MKLLSISGRLVNKNVTRYLIDWEGKSPSIPQRKVKQFLKPFWKSGIVYEEFPVFGSLLSVDLLNATKKIAIEVHGPQHEEFHYFHNGNRFNYLKGIKNDVMKSEWLQKNGFYQVIIYTREIGEISESFFLEKFGIIL